MQDSMQHENLNFVSGRVAQGSRVLRRDLRRDGDLSGELFLSIRLGRKRKYVSRLVLPAKTPVQRFHLGVRCEQHVDRALQPRGQAGAGHEPVKRQLGYIVYALLKDDQFPTVLSSTQQ